MYRHQDTSISCWFFLDNGSTPHLYSYTAARVLAVLRQRHLSRRAYTNPRSTNEQLHSISGAPRH